MVPNKGVHKQKWLPYRQLTSFRLLVTTMSGSCCWVASPACVLVVRWALPVRRCSALWLPSGALNGRPFFPSRAATGQSLLTAPAARAACGAVSVLTPPPPHT